MDKYDMDELHRIILLYGLPEVISAIGGICSAHALNIANRDAHTAKIWMAMSQDLDDVNAKIEERLTDDGSTRAHHA